MNVGDSIHLLCDVLMSVPEDWQGMSFVINVKKSVSMSYTYIASMTTPTQLWRMNCLSPILVGDG